MKDLLFLSHRIPYPPDKGEKIRAWHILRTLARSHRIHLGCFADDPADLAHLGHLREVCADVLCLPINPLLRRARALLRLAPGRPLSLGYFNDRRLRAWVAGKLAEGVGSAFVYCTAMAPYLLHADLPGPRILDMVDVDSAKWDEYARTARGPRRLLWAREARTLAAFERRAAKDYDRTLFVSPAEAACFGAAAPDSMARIGWVENGVDLAYFDPRAAYPDPYVHSAFRLVFTGTMNYRPNVEAVQWFVREVMPLLQLDAPGMSTRPCHLTVVGAHPSRAVRRLAGAQVTVTGAVPDIRPYLAHADAVIAPLQIARGVQNKLLEAMAMGRPVIASPQAFAGILASPGRDLLVADSACAMAQAIAEVARGAHSGLGRAARRAMEQRYAWDVRLAGLADLFAGSATQARGLRTEMAPLNMTRLDVAS